jgi:hypothetical protein
VNNGCKVRNRRMTLRVEHGKGQKHRFAHAQARGGGVVAAPPASRQCVQQRKRGASPMVKAHE